MFENWAADVLANYLGKFVDVQRDRLRISLWGGEGTLDHVQLRVDAFDHLQLPFLIKGGSIGRLKLQIPWGRWRGGALVVELSDVALCVSPREESDWEEGPALRRLQAAKQAQLAAAELAKLGSRVAATGRGATTQQQADYAAATAAGTAANTTAASAAGPAVGSSWGWAIVDYVASFLLNRLQVTIKNVHVYFEASAGSTSEYEAFGVQLGSLTTVVPGRVPDILAAFAGLKPMEPAAAAKVVRQLHIHGWSCYWKPRRVQHEEALRQQHQQQTRISAMVGNTRQAFTAPPIAAAAKLELHPTDYVLAPMEAIMEVTVHGRSSAVAAGQSSNSSISTGLACDVFIGAPEVALQLSTQQLVGMARLADDATIWAKRNKYGRYRPPGWITELQATRQRNPRHPYQSSGANTSGLQDDGRSSCERSRQCSPCVVPTGRCGVGAPVTWLQVWHYAAQAIIADLHSRRRKQQGRVLRKSEVMARRRYVHLYQQKLDSLQQAPTSTIVSPTSVVNITSTADESASDSSRSATSMTPEATRFVKGSEVQCAAAVAAVACEAQTAPEAIGKTLGVSYQDVSVELTKLEQELEVEDILLCRSLAEVALDRSASSSETERYRSWFAWGTSAIGTFLYPNAQSAVSTSSGKAASGKSFGSSSSGTSMPTEADLDELLSLLHSRNADGTATGISAAAATAAAMTGGAPGAEAAAIGTATAADVTGSQTGPARPTASPCIALNWQLLRLGAVVQDCTEAHLRRELLVFDIEGTSIQGKVKDHSLSGQLQLQEFRLFDCCSDPGVRECVLQRLDPASPVAIASRVSSLRPSQGWGLGLTGLGLRQGAGLQQQSPEAYGWGDMSMPAVSSARNKPAGGAKSYAAAVAAGHASTAAAAHTPIKQPLLSIAVDVSGSSKSVAVQLEQLQLLARPGCVVGVLSMLQQLPQDTLQQQERAAAAVVQAAHGKHRFTNHDRQAEQGTHSVQIPAWLLQLQLSVVLQEVLVVLPTELNYESGLNTVVHLQGLKLSPVESVQQQSAAEGQSDCESTITEDLLLEEGSEESGLGTNTSSCTVDSDASDSSGRSEAGSHSRTCASTTIPAAAGASQPQLLQQQYTLQLALLTLSMQQPADAGTRAGQTAAVPQQQMQELLKLLAVQGSVVVTRPARKGLSARDADLLYSIPAGSDDGAESRSAPPVARPLPQSRQLQQLQQRQQVPLVRVGLQLPPLSSTVTASVVSSVRQLMQVLQLQLRLPLAEFVTCYRLSLPEQLAAGTQRQQGQKPLNADHPPQAAVDASASPQTEPPSPTDSDIERWLAAPSSVHGSHTAAGASDRTVDSTRLCLSFARSGAEHQARSSLGDYQQQHADASAALVAGHEHQQQQLDRCDSDCLLESMSPSSTGLHLPSPPDVQQQQQQGSPVAAADVYQLPAPRVVTAPDVQLIEFELLWEELDVQYVENGLGHRSADVSTEQIQQQQPPGQQQQNIHTGSPLHFRLQTSMLRVLFRHSTHSSRAEVTCSDLVLQDMLSAPSAAAATPDVKRLLNHVLSDQVQLVWRQQLKASSVVQETQVALLGLQAQGHPGDTGLFLLPAQQDSLASISANITNTQPYQQAAWGVGTSTTSTTQVSVQLHNVALGLDGILKFVAAVQAATAASSHPGKQSQRSGVKMARKDSRRSDEGSSFGLQVQLLQCQLLSCNGIAHRSAAGRLATGWQSWGGGTAATAAAAGVCTAASQSGVLRPGQGLGNVDGLQQVVCDLLLELPSVSLNIIPQPPPSAAAPTAVSKQRPVLVIEGLAVYLPESSGSDHLLPVISVPAVVFRQTEERVDPQQVAEHSGVTSNLVQHLHIPAVGASARPAQIQHVVHLVDRQQQQWRTWTAAIPKRDKQQERSKQQKKHHDSSTLTAAVDDLQLLLLAAPGTSDKGLLLQWQQVLVRVDEKPVNISRRHSQSDTAAIGGCKHGQGPFAGSEQPLLDGRVCWSELALHAVQEDDAVTADGHGGEWLQAATPTTAAGDAPAAGATAARQTEDERQDSGQLGQQHGTVEVLPLRQGMEQHPQQQHDSVQLLASSLPAVSFLRHASCSNCGIKKYTSQQQQQQQTDFVPASTVPVHSYRPLSAFASAAASAAAAVSGPDNMTSSSLSVPSRSLQQTQPTLSKFSLSAKESWHSVESRSSILNASDIFFSPQNSSTFLSSASSLANSSSGSNWSSVQGRSSVGGVQAAVASSGNTPPPTGSAAVPIATQDSIIAASWQLDPSGSSPAGSVNLWGSAAGAQGVSALFVSGGSPPEAAAVQYSAALESLKPAAGSALMDAQQSSSPATAAAGCSPLRQRLDSGSRSRMRHTTTGVWGPASGAVAHKGSSSPVPMFRSSHLSLAGDSSSQGLQGASPGVPLSFSSHWLDIEDEFFSVAGDSSMADDISTLGDVESEGASPAAQGHIADVNVTDVQLLPLVGFGSHGCQGKARWLLLSLTAGRISDGSPLSDAAADAVPRTAAHITITSKQGQAHQQAPVTATSALSAAEAANGGNGDAAEPAGCLQQHVSVMLYDWQLMVNSMCWDMVAGCVLQAVNAAISSATLSSSRAAYQQEVVVYDSKGRMLQQPAAASTGTAVVSVAVSRIVRINLQQLQVTLFVPPIDAPAVMVYHGSSAQQQMGLEAVSSKDFGPWQDPGAHGSPTAHSAAGSSRNSKASSFCTPFKSPAQQQQQQAEDASSSDFKLAAQLIVIRVKASAVLSDVDSSSHAMTIQQRMHKSKQPLQLQDLDVPELSVSISAAEWDAATARPSVAADPHAALPEQLRVLLLKGAHVSASLLQQGQDVQHSVPQRADADSIPSVDQPTVSRLLDDSIAVTLPVHVRAPASTISTNCQAVSSAAGQQGYVVDLGSISCWVSTMRLSLLLNLQQQLLQQWPALTAAAAMAGPSKYRGTGADAYAAQYAEFVAAVAPVPGGLPDVYLQPAQSVAASQDCNLLSGTRSRLRDHNSRSAVPRTRGLCCSITVHKVAVLVSTDEPEPWLLQPSASSWSPRTHSSPNRIGGLLPGSTIGSALAVCTTPLLEVALLPVTVRLQIITQPAAASATVRAGCSTNVGSVVRVSLKSVLRADVYSVDKLGWEPVLDPWCLEASLEFAQPGANAGGSSSESLLKAAVLASNLLDLTISPSCIIALQQLQALTVAATAWQADPHRLQQLLLCLSSPAEAAALTSGGRGCWLINQTGQPLTYTVAEAASGPVAAAMLALDSSTLGSSSSSSPGLHAAGVPGLRGQAAHQDPVPLPLLDSASAEYHGRYVETADGSAAEAVTAGKEPQKTPLGAADGRKQFQLLYLQASGQLSVMGPIALDKLGCSLHNMAQPSSVGVGAVVGRAATAAGGYNRRSRQHQLVVETSRHHYGGRLVSLHSTVQLVNSSSLQLQLGCCGSLEQTGDPVVLDTLGPGESMWLPLQVLHSSAPSLCLRPAGAAAERYSWCRAFDPLSLLPATHSSASGSLPAEVATVGAATDDTGFWYCPRKPRAASQYITFKAVKAAQQMHSAVQGSSDGAVMSPGSAGQVVLSLGCSGLPWPAAANSMQVPAGGASSGIEPGHASSATGLWKLVVEAPAVFTNQLPVPVQVSILAGKGEAVGLQAVLGSRQSLPLYGCEAQYFSSMQVKVSGFQQSNWIPISTTLASLQTSEVPAATLADDRKQAGQSQGLPDNSQLVQDLGITISGARNDQPGQTLKLRTSRSNLTGSLSISISCSLWLFNCLGFQVAVKQPGSVCSSTCTREAHGGNSRPTSPLHRRAPFSSIARSERAKSSSSVSQNARSSGDHGMLWLKPYPWLADSATTPGLKDLTLHGQDAAGIAVSLAASNSASTLPRSASTPAVSTLGLGALTSPTAAAASAARLAGSITPELQPQQTLPYTPARVCFNPELVGLLSPRRDSRGLQTPSSMFNQSQELPYDVPESSNLEHEHRPRGWSSLRRSLSSSSLGMPQFLLSQQQRQRQHAVQGDPESPKGVSAQNQGPVRPQSAHAAVGDGVIEAVDAYDSQQCAAAAMETPARSRRQRRHSSGLFMLASGRLPNIVQDVKGGQEDPDESALPHIQRVHFQTAGATKHRTEFNDGGVISGNSEPVVLPLQDPTHPGVWLPLLAAGALDDATFEPPARSSSTRPFAADAAMQDASQQRSAEASAVTEQLLAELSGSAVAMSQQRHSAPAGPAQSSAGAAVAGLMHDGRTTPSAVGLSSLMSSGAGSQGVLGVAMRPQQGRQSAPLVSAATSTVASAATEAVPPQSAMSPAAHSVLASVTAAPVLCGWPCQVDTAGGGGTGNCVPSDGTGLVAGHCISSINLQVCAAPAALGAAAHRNLQQAASMWSQPATVELRQGGSGPVSVLKLPLALSGMESATARTSFGGLESVAAAEGVTKMHPSTSSGTLASLGSGASSTAAGQRTPAGSWGSRRRDSQATTQQQGVCYVSVHTVPVPGGGGAWAVHLLPTYLLYNSLQSEVQLRQYGTDIVLQTVPPGGYCCVLWPDAKLPLKLQFRVAEPGWSWSGAAAVEAPGEFLVKIRHRNRGETLLLQLDVVAASSGSSMVATLSAPEGGFSPYRLDNCSCETIHVQQVGCVEQEDVLQPYSSLPFAWDEPSLPHRVLLFLPGHRLLGEIPLEQVGQSRRVSIAGHKKRTLLLTTYAEGPMRVLRILDTSMHLQQQQPAAMPASSQLQQPGTAAYASATTAASGQASTGSQVASGIIPRSNSSTHLQRMSRSSSSTSLNSSTHQTSQQQQQSGMSNTQGSALQGRTVSAGPLRPAEKHQMLRRLGAFLGLPVSAQQQQQGMVNSNTTAVNISSPSVDVQVQLQGFGVSLVSETRELLYLCAKSVNTRFCQDPVRTAVGFCVGSIRVENTLYGCQYPLLLVTPIGRSVFGVVVPPVAAGAPSSGRFGNDGAITTASRPTDAAVSAAGISRVQADDSAPSDLVHGTTNAESSAAEDQNNSFPTNSIELQQGSDMQPISQSAAAAVAASSGTTSLALTAHQQSQSVLLPHHLAVGVLATVWRSRPSGVVCIEQLGLQVSPCALSLEGKHIKQLVDFFTSMSATSADSAAGSTTGSRSISRKLVTQQQQQQPVRPPSIPAAAAQRSHVKLYVEDLKISAITLCVSFAPDSWFDPLPGVTSSVTRTPGTGVTSDLTKLGPLVTPSDVTNHVTVAQESGTSKAPEATDDTASDEHHTQLNVPASSMAPEITAEPPSTDSGDVVGAAAVAAAAGGQQPIWLQMALALAHAEEGAWLTLGAYETSHACVNTDSLGQVLGRHYILAAYRELPKVLASLDIFGDPARLLQALGLGFWHLLTLPAHSARWGPYRSLQRLLRGVRVMAYGISSSIAKGSKRSKAALLPLVPAGLHWQQQQQPPAGQQQGSIVLSGSLSSTAKDAAGTMGDMWPSGFNNSMLAGGDGLAASISSSSSSEQTSGQDLLHVLVAGYSLTFQQMLRSFQSGHPVRAVVTAAAQALVLPALLLLEISESTAASFRRLLVEQVAGAVPVRVPRYVAAGQLLRPYDRLESLGRVLLHHAPGPFACEEFLGCVELQLGLYAVVTVGHLLVLACHVKAAGGAAAGSSAASSAAGSDPQQQQQAVYVQYKHPELLFVLGVKDMMMVAVEGSAVRLLCISGNHAVSVVAAAVNGSAASAAAVAHQVADSLQQAVTTPKGDLAAVNVDVQEAATSSCQGLRELVSTESAEQQSSMEQQTHAAEVGSAVTTSHGSAVAEDSEGGSQVVMHQEQLVSSEASNSAVSYPTAAAPSIADATAAAAAAGAAAAVANSDSSIVVGSPESLQAGTVGHESGDVRLIGGKWFVGHVVPSGSENAAKELQQLLQTACSRLDRLIARSVWQRQLML